MKQWPLSKSDTVLNLMTCPRCRIELIAGTKLCPSCGVSIVQTVSGVMKTSAVLISAGDEEGFYRSVQDVPQPLRQKLIDTTTGRNSHTILIADRAGREQLSQALYQSNQDVPSENPARKRRLVFLAWMGVALVLTIAALFAAYFPMRW